MPVIALIYALGALLYGAGVFLYGLAELADTELLRKHFSEQPHMMQSAPLMSEAGEALYAEFQHQMDRQYEVGILRRYGLTLKALPEEGY